MYAYNHFIRHTQTYIPAIPPFIHTGVNVSELSFCKPAAKSFCEMAAVVSGAGVKLKNMPSHVKPDSLALIRSSRNLLVGSAVGACGGG